MNDDLNSVKLSSSAASGDAAKGRYHHGDLRAALIEAGTQVLAERGLEGFSLRECARRAAVSPAAPAHHFGDAKGLLTAIAAKGFAEFGAALEAAQAGLTTRSIRLRAQGRAYVRFARANPAYFDLMWRSALLNQSDPDFRRAADAAFATLAAAVPESAQGKQNANAVAAWALVHGYARLMLDGPLADAPETFLDQVLERLSVS
jgi:AcrR family transcriptional regulator